MDEDDDPTCEDCGATGEPVVRQLSILLALAGDYAAAEAADDVEVSGYECPSCGLFWGTTTAKVGDGFWGKTYRGTGEA